MVGWHHQLNGHEFEQALGNGEGQGSLACYSPWGWKELGTTQWLNNNNHVNKVLHSHRRWDFQHASKPTSDSTSSGERGAGTCPIPTNPTHPAGIRSTHATNRSRTDLIYLDSKITVDGDCSHGIQRRLLLGRKAMTNLDSILKSRDMTLLTKVHRVIAMVFPVVMYGCESWTIKKAEHQRTDAFELWCWRRLLRVPWWRGWQDEMVWWHHQLNGYEFEQLWKIVKDRET